jgi:hypothetical protein
MTMSVPQGNDATSTTEASVAGRWRHWWQWRWQKQQNDNDGNYWQQKLKCGPGIALSTTIATGAMSTIMATVATARTAKIMTTALDRGWRP